MAKRALNKTDIDPELTRQLDKATADDSVEAVFTLRSPKGKAILDPGETKETVDRILADAGVKPNNLKVFSNLQSFAVVGSPGLVRSLIDHDEVATATANTQAEDMRIEPKPSKSPSPKRSGKH